MFSDLKFHFRTEVRSYPKKRSYAFFNNRSFRGVEPQEGLKNVPDILTHNFLEIGVLTATGAGRALLVRAKMDDFFLEKSKSRGANLLVSCRRDELGITTSSSSRLMCVGKGVIWANLEKYLV